MKRVAMVALLALFAGCADGLTAPKDPHAGVVASKPKALATEGYCFIEFEGCVPYQPPTSPPPTPLVPVTCYYVLYVDDYGRFFEVLVCPGGVPNQPSPSGPKRPF